MNATDRHATAARLLHTTAAGAGAMAALATAGHSAIVCTALAAAITISGLASLAREWFWYSALRRPARNLKQVLQLTGGEKGETERLMRLLQDSENNVLTARAATSGHAGKRRTS
jgi:hypothetical protein